MKHSAAIHYLVVYRNISFRQLSGCDKLIVAGIAGLARE
jgi:hypothetical protein